MPDATRSPLLLRGPLLAPRADGTVEFWADGAIASDPAGRINYLGDAAMLPEASHAPRGTGLLMPPLVDAHIHIPQHPIRGRFAEGIGPHPAEGRLVAGLQRNVFPAEGRCADPSVAEQVVRDFLADTLAQGVVGGAAYMTVHAAAVERALELLPDAWSVGLVLMNQFCPEYLRTDAAQLDADVARLVERFGARLIVTDRFAVAVDTPLRRRASALAGRYGLRTQTHLNEQRPEKQLVARCYPRSASYTAVYADDGLLDHACILAHCIHMGDDEWSLVERHGSVVAHCPTSNTLLGSGIMPLDTVLARGVPYAICTDVGASPTTSLLAEMAQFLKVHAGRHAGATPSEALYRATLAPATLLGLDRQMGALAVGRPLSCIEVDGPTAGGAPQTADDAILAALGTSAAELAAYAEAHRLDLQTLADSGLDAGPPLAALERDVAATARSLEGRVRRVIVGGEEIWSRR